MEKLARATVISANGPTVSGLKGSVTFLLSNQILTKLFSGAVGFVQIFQIVTELLGSTGAFSF